MRPVWKMLFQAALCTSVLSLEEDPPRPHSSIRQILSWRLEQVFGMYWHVEEWETDPGSETHQAVTGGMFFCPRL